MLGIKTLTASPRVTKPSVTKRLCSISRCLPDSGKQLLVQASLHKCKLLTLASKYGFQNMEVLNHAIVSVCGASRGNQSNLNLSIIFSRKPRRNNKPLQEYGHKILKQGMSIHMEQLGKTEHDQNRYKHSLQSSLGIAIALFSYTYFFSHSFEPSQAGDKIMKLPEVSPRPLCNIGGESCSNKVTQTTRPVWSTNIRQLKQLVMDH